MALFRSFYFLALILCFTSREGNCDEKSPVQDPGGLVFATPPDELQTAGEKIFSKFTEEKKGSKIYVNQPLNLELLGEGSNFIFITDGKNFAWALSNGRFDLELSNGSIQDGSFPLRVRDPQNKIDIISGKYPWPRDVEGELIEAKYLISSNSSHHLLEDILTEKFGSSSYRFGHVGILGGKQIDLGYTSGSNILGDFQDERILASNRRALFHEGVAQAFSGYNLKSTLANAPTDKNEVLEQNATKRYPPQLKENLKRPQVPELKYFVDFKMRAVFLRPNVTFPVSVQKFEAEIDQVMAYPHQNLVSYIFQYYVKHSSQLPASTQQKVFQLLQKIHSFPSRSSETIPLEIKKAYLKLLLQQSEEGAESEKKEILAQSVQWFQKQISHSFDESERAEEQKLTHFLVEQMQQFPDFAKELLLSERDVRKDGKKERNLSRNIFAHGFNYLPEENVEELLLGLFESDGVYAFKRKKTILEDLKKNKSLRNKIFDFAFNNFGEAPSLNYFQFVLSQEPGLLSIDQFKRLKTRLMAGNPDYSLRLQYFFDGAGKKRSFDVEKDYRRRIAIFELDLQNPFGHAKESAKNHRKLESLMQSDPSAFIYLLKKASLNKSFYIWLESFLDHGQKHQTKQYAFILEILANNPRVLKELKSIRSLGKSKRPLQEKLAEEFKKHLKAESIVDPAAQSLWAQHSLLGLYAGYRISLISKEASKKIILRQLLRLGFFPMAKKARAVELLNEMNVEKPEFINFISQFLRLYRFRPHILSRHQKHSLNDSALREQKNFEELYDQMSLLADSLELEHQTHTPRKWSFSLARSCQVLLGKILPQ